MARDLCERCPGTEVRLLVVTPAASPAVLAVAADLEVSILVADSGGVTGVLRPPGAASVFLDRQQPALARPRPPGRVPWGTYALAFALLDAPAPDQAILAARAGVTRSRATQVLATLGDLVAHTKQGWAPADHLALAGWLADHYPTTTPLSTTWASLDPPVHTAETVSAYLGAADVAHAVSGPVAADLLAPWARPSDALLWSASLVDLQPLGLTPAPHTEATLTLAVSPDPHLLPTARTARDLPVLPGWRLWVDLVHHGHRDAADSLATAIIQGQAT
ncbi:hypothetical protein Q6348_08415 [Isoptericola sp. b441]|uniref:Uncharacterized protein n=1 Tax=Actinotalea lenta TaxID=3064654 RepID=A0ABT9DD11_9CELL|nr:hypothetical protein [Isoptericola sp. b441]MDO8107216.1 hypothetical protein [Isoptericola sp. b441]